MNKTWTIAIIALVVLAVVAGYFLMNKKEVPAAPVVTPTPVTGPQTHSIDISNMVFNPASITIKAGDTVTWTNNDAAKHIVAGDGGIKSGTLSTGDTYSQTFKTAGTLAYHCEIHPAMKGTIVVE